MSNLRSSDPGVEAFNDFLGDQYRVDQGVQVHAQRPQAVSDAVKLYLLLLPVTVEDVHDLIGVRIFHTRINPPTLRCSTDCPPVDCGLRGICSRPVP